MELIKIDIDTSIYEEPTYEDIKEGKEFVRKRHLAALALVALISKYLRSTAEDIMRICYRYNVAPEAFTIAANPRLEDEIYKLMDSLEDKVSSAITLKSIYSTDEAIKSLMGISILASGSQGKNFTQTLQNYTKRFLYDLEALAASYLMAKLSLPQALSKLPTALKGIYDQPEVKAAYKAPTARALYIQTKGIHYDFETGQPTRGLARNGATNILNFAKNVLSYAWMKQQALEFEEKGAIGYFQMRGSGYPCTICDDAIGFHEGTGDIWDDPLPHPNCMCYRFPVFIKM